MHVKLVKHIFFPALQNIIGRKRIGKSLSQIEKTQWYNSAKIKDMQLEKLQSVIEYAYQRIPYYREKFVQTGIVPSDIRSLSDVTLLPVLQKRDIKENLPLMVDPDFKGKLIKNYTSGSSGHPMSFYEDGRKNADSIAAYLRFLRWYGIDNGAREARFLRLTSEMCQGSKRNLVRKIMLNQIVLPGMGFSERDFEDCFKEMQKFRPRVIFGITSALYMFTQYIVKENKNLENLRPDIIVAWAAPLYPYQRVLMEATFNCPVANLYSTREVGHIAAECPEKSLHINDENLLVEVVNQGKPCRVGEPGNILVTTLNQYPMPFIRYDIGDIAILDEATCSCGRGLGVIRELVGRSGEILTTPGGKKLSPNFWCRMMMSDSVAMYIKQFRVIQKTRSDILIEIVREHGYNEEHTGFLRKIITANIGNDVHLHFNFVENIPSEKSGKYKIVVSELKEPYDREVDL
jgi:phenylacetate-CoA ligase